MSARRDDDEEDDVSPEQQAYEDGIAAGVFARKQVQRHMTTEEGDTK